MKLLAALLPVLLLGLASSATLLRDLAYAAWVESDQPFRFNRDSNPIDPKNPAYYLATGSAPPGPPVQR